MFKLSKRLLQDFDTVILNLLVIYELIIAIYFFGAFFRVSTRKSQNFCTVAMFTFSSGE